MKTRFFEPSFSDTGSRRLNAAKPMSINSQSLNQKELGYFKKEFDELLKHTALSEWIQAEALWNKFPVLFTYRGTVDFPNIIHAEGKEPYHVPTDKHPGRYKYVNCTVFQIALMNEEWDIAAKMAKLMKEDDLDVQEEFFEVFPDGEMKHRLDLAKVKSLLADLFDSVVIDTNINAKNLDEMYSFTRFYLHKLYDYVKPPAEHTTGPVFDANIYIAALELYRERSKEFMNEDQRSFWCIRVEEYLAALLPTNHLRFHSRGVHTQSVEEEYANIYRSKVHEYADEISRTNLVISGCTMQGGSIHPFRRTADSIPGFHFFVGMSGGELVRGGRGSILDRRIDVLQKFCKEQATLMTDFVQQFEPSSLSLRK